MATVTVRERPRLGQPAAEQQQPERALATPDRTGSAALWALLGVISLAIALEVWIRWIASPTQFAAAPINNADHYANARLIGLRVTEVVSAVVLVWLMWATVARPLKRDRKLGIDGKIAIACLIGCITDGLLDVYKYLFAWNAHSVNLGSWSQFMPFHSSSANPRYAEALIWGIPMYVYFCIGVALAGCAIVKRLRARYPQISNVAALGVVFGLACVFDFIVENAIIHTTQAYAFSRTPSSVTVWAGKLYQFPLYETLCVGALGTIFTALRLSAIDSPDGISFLETGFQRFRPGLREPVRVLAVIGFAITMLVVVYHIPVNWLGTNGNSIAHLPSYMLP